MENSFLADVFESPTAVRRLCLHPVGDGRPQLEAAVVACGRYLSNCFEGSVTTPR